MKLSIANGRSVAEWIGANADTPVPDRVRLRVWDRAHGRCHRCGRKIGAAERWTLEHVVALINGGENRERNLNITCSWCLPDKNAADVAEKASIYGKRRKHILGKPKGRGFYRPPGSTFDWRQRRYVRNTGKETG